MQITFKILLDKRYIKKNETFGLKLRIYQDRDYKDCSLGINVHMKDWNEQLQMVCFSNVNHQIYNTKLARIKAKVYKCILFNEDEDVIITPSEIIDQIKRIDKRRTVALKPDILKYGREHVIKLQSAGNIGNSICYSCAINKLQSFAKKDKLLFEEVNYKFLEDFNNKLLPDGIKVNSIFIVP